MKIQKTPLHLLGLGLLFSGSTLSAQIPVDDDNASRTEYEDGITEFENGSSNPNGLGGWVFGSGIESGDFTVASGSSNGGTDQIDVSGDAFRLIDSDASGDFTGVTRFLDDSSGSPTGSLSAGQSFSFQMDVNFRDGFKGVNIFGADNSTRIFNFESSTNVDGNDTDGYIVNDASSGSGSLFGNMYDADTVFTLDFDQTSVNGGDWLITRSGGLSGTASGTYEGRFSSFELFTLGAGNDTNNAILYNNFEIVPEPSAFALIAGTLGLACVMLRRRKA